MNLRSFTKEEVLARAAEIYRTRYADAIFCVAAGSIIQGEGTIGSDLDLIVLYEKLDHGYREAFFFEGLPVEVFVHDPETLQAFIDSDHKSAHSAMFHMLATGVVLPEECEISGKLRRYGQMKLDAGAPPMTAEREASLRYVISDRIDDLKGERPLYEQRALLYSIYENMAELLLRKKGQFLAMSKRIPRQMKDADPAFMQTLDKVMVAGHQETGVTAAEIQILEDLLTQLGGYNFDNYYRAAPADMRKKAEWL